MGVEAESGLAAVRLGSPPLYETILGAFAGPLGRAELSRADRELCTVAILAAIGDAPRQLAVHVAAALRAGYTASELRALCEHVSVYAGIPRALNALEVIYKVVEEKAPGTGLPPSERHVHVRDHDSVVGHAGDAIVPVILVHGLATDRHMWDAVVPLLSGEKSIYTVDLRGHGSASYAPAPQTFDDYVNDLVTVMDQLGIDAAHLVGVSLGASVVQAVALRAPERTLSVTALGAIDRPDPVFIERAVAGERGDTDEQVTRTLLRWFSEFEIAQNTRGVRYAREQLVRCSPANWGAAWRAFATLDIAEQLPGLKPPSLFVAAENDTTITPQANQEVAARVPGSRTHVLKGTSHAQPLSRPDLVGAAICDFIDAIGQK